MVKRLKLSSYLSTSFLEKGFIFTVKAKGNKPFKFLFTKSLYIILPFYRLGTAVIPILISFG